MNLWRRLRTKISKQQPKLDSPVKYTPLQHKSILLKSSKVYLLMVGFLSIISGPNILKFLIFNLGLSRSSSYFTIILTAWIVKISYFITAPCLFLKLCLLITYEPVFLKRWWQVFFNWLLGGYILVKYYEYCLTWLW